MKTEFKDIWKFGSEKRNLICYTKESISHPAKMSLHLCREIIKRYSKPGELILDVMAGIGTTLIEGMLLGRNVIGIEYEQKFVDMATENIKKTERSMKFMCSLGKGVILKGDSRELSQVLAKADIPDSIIFSPPFANSNPCENKNQGEKQKEQWDKNKVKGGSGFLNKIHSQDKNNISNMDYGQVDQIITSPPYSEAIQRGSGIAKKGHWKDPKLKDRVYCKEQDIKQLKERADKFAEKYPEKRNILMEAYLSAKGDPRYKKNYDETWHCFSEYSPDENNLGNLPHGEIDSIITSPPYGNRLADEDRTNHQLFADMGGNEKWLYSKDKKNLGNKKGKNYLTEMYRIYLECYKVLRNQGFMILVLKNFVRKGVQIRLDLDTIKLVEKAGFTYKTRHYRKITNPSFWITNAIQKYEKKYPGKPHPYPLEEDVLVFQKLAGEEGAIDTIAFSPPFADSLSKGTDPAKFGNKGNWRADEKYSSDQENIGNLKY